MSHEQSKTTQAGAAERSALALAWGYQCPHQPCRQHDSQTLALQWIATEGARLCADIGRVKAENARLVRRIEKQRRILTRLLEARRSANAR
jgi:hypothetical protein